MPSACCRQQLIGTGLNAIGNGELLHGSPFSYWTRLLS